jgi:hypothetical protein
VRDYACGLFPHLGSLADDMLRYLSLNAGGMPALPHLTVAYTDRPQAASFTFQYKLLAN